MLKNELNGLYQRNTNEVNARERERESGHGAL